jgi:2-polyprenyl-6-methoxyphenol hydroxylase-like FAD-dependent oxidoreductase
MSGTTFIPEPHLLDSPRRRYWPTSLTSGARDQAPEPPAAADVVIVGAGPAGLAVASALWHLDVRNVVLLDRADRSCGRFFDRVDVLGQRVLRSPYEHHPGVEGYRDCELLDFARLHWSLLTSVERREIRMAQAGHRSVVPVDVFEAFCRHVTGVHRVAERTWRTTVRAVRPEPDNVTVDADGYRLRAGYVILCLGEERRSAPATWWGDAAPPSGVGYWDEPVPDAARDIVVVGAGLTAAHLIHNALTGGRRVRWVMRESGERYQCADVNATFFRPEGRARFDGLGWADRLALMGTQRRASIMYEFRPLLRDAEADGRLTVHRGRAVTAVASGPDGAPCLRLDDGTRIGGDHVVLALGTTVSTGEALLGTSLAATRSGWADLDPRTLAYRHAPRVFAVGAAACMALGPAARNIDGHRVGTARVATAVATGLSSTAAPVPDPVEAAAAVARA